MRWPTKPVFLRKTGLTGLPPGCKSRSATWQKQHHMPEYRAYIIGYDGHFQSSVNLECADDAEASDEAKKLVDGHDVELWQRDRMVAKFEHSAEGP